MFDVTALGELLIDFTFTGNSSSGNRLFEQNPGGAPANVLACLSRCGKKTAFIGTVGADMHGQYLRAVLTENSIDTTGLSETDRAFTTLAFEALSDTGERTFSFARHPGADTCLTPKAVPDEIIRNSRVFHFGSISLSAEPSRTATLHALEIAREAGCVITYAPNYRAPLWASREEAVRGMRAAIPYADMIKIASDESELLTGCTAPEDAAMALVMKGVRVCVVTMGQDGALVAVPDGIAHVPTIPSPAHDTTGAGDAFWGGFLTAFLESGLSPAELSLTDCIRFARFGNAAAGLCIRKHGGISAMPKRDEIYAVLDLMKGN